MHTLSDSRMGEGFVDLETVFRLPFCSPGLISGKSPVQNLQWGRHGFANLRYLNITFNQWGMWTGDWLHPSWPEV